MMIVEVVGYGDFADEIVVYGVFFKSLRRIFLRRKIELVISIRTSKRKKIFISSGIKRRVGIRVVVVVVGLVFLVL